MSESEIIRLTTKFAPRLLVEEITSYSIEQKWCYLFGEKMQINFFNEDELNKYLKFEFTNYLNTRVRELEQIMGIKKPYKIHVRNTKTRYGSNSSKTHSLSFQIGLVHFSKDIIDSVIIHELAHDKYHNHQEEFYNEVKSINHVNEDSAMAGGKLLYIPYYDIPWYEYRSCSYAGRLRWICYCSKSKRCSCSAGNRPCYPGQHIFIYGCAAFHSYGKFRISGGTKRWTL